MVTTSLKIGADSLYSTPRNERAVAVREQLTAWLSEVDGGCVDEITRTEQYALMRLRPATPDIVSNVRFALETDQIRHRLGFTSGDIDQHEDEIFVRVPWPEED